MNKTKFCLIYFLLTYSMAINAQTAHNLRPNSICKFVKKSKGFNFEGASACNACVEQGKKNEIALNNEFKKRIAEGKKQEAENLKKIQQDYVKRSAALKQKIEAQSKNVVSFALPEKQIKPSPTIKVAYKVESELSSRETEKSSIPNPTKIFANDKVVFKTSAYKYVYNYNYETKDGLGLFYALKLEHRYGCNRTDENLVLINSLGKVLSIDGRTTFNRTYMNRDGNLELMCDIGPCEAYPNDNYYKSTHQETTYTISYYDLSIISKKTEKVKDSCPCN